MVKKLKKMAEQKSASPAGLLDSQLAGAVKASAQQIWLAGMGAFAKAQEEGTKVFEALVKEGVSLQRKTQAVAEERFGDVSGKVSAMAGEVTNKAGASWDKLESIFEARTAKALSKLGVPTARDVEALTERVDALAGAVAKLGGKATPTKKADQVKPAKATKAVKATRTVKAPKAAPEAGTKKASGAKKAVEAKKPATPRKAAARKGPVKSAPAADETMAA